MRKVTEDLGKQRERFSQEGPALDHLINPEKRSVKKKVTLNVALKFYRSTRFTVIRAIRFSNDRRLPSSCCVGILDPILAALAI